MQMTPRDRFRRFMHYQSVDRIPHMEFGYWTECFPKWHSQGLPERLNDNYALECYLGCEHVRMLPVRLDLIPPFRREVLEDRGNTQVIRDEDGVIGEVYSDGTSTIPRYVEFPIKDRKTWEEFKQRLDPETADRYAYKIEQVKSEAQASPEPLGIHIGSMFGKLRNWTGFEQICYMVHDDRDLVEEMVEHMCGLVMRVIEPLLKEIEVDVGWGWEDICFNHGPIISPTTFREILFPRYKRIASLLRRHGVTVIFTDCDGDVSPVVPIWMEAGYNCIFPVEVHAGADPVALRKEYGKDLLMIGGYDKQKLVSRRDILDEWKRLEPVVSEGGYIPHVDHRVPANIDFENYLYYIKCKKEIFGIETIDVPGLDTV